MKGKNGYGILVLLLLLVACSTHEKEKKSSDQSVNGSAGSDSSQNSIASPSLEKEFADTLLVRPAGDSVRLKFNFQKARTYHYAMTFRVEQNRGDQSTLSTMKWNYDMQVVDEHRDLKTIKTTYKQIGMTLDMGKDMKMEFSSEKQVEPGDLMQMPSRMFSIIKGKSFTMQVNAKGEVDSVSGFDKIREAVVNEMNLPAEMKPMMRQNFQKQFNDDEVKQIFSQAFDFYPDRFVKVGDSWKTNSTLTALKQDITTVYTVKNIRGNRVFLNGESRLRSADGKNSGTQTSKLIIDARTGLMLDGVFDQKTNEGKTTTRSRITGKAI